MKLYYFAWIREQIGKSSEEIDLPETVTTIADLIDWLAKRGPEYKEALANRDTIKTAINQTHVSHETSLAGATEIALFPPVTGG